MGRALALSDKLVDLYGMGGRGSKRRRMASTVATLAERAQRVAASGLREAYIDRDRRGIRVMRVGALCTSDTESMAVGKTSDMTACRQHPELARLAPCCLKLKPPSLSFGVASSEGSTTARLQREGLVRD